MTTTQEPASDLAQFDRKLDELHLRGQWQYDAQLVQLTDGPVPAGVPFRWSWELADRALTEMCTAVSGETARRNFTFINPAPDVNGTTQTLAMGMQITLPGEIAPAHRHSINALRFVVDGSPDLFTAVDGEKLAMEDGDLIITPAYSWHDHHNESDKRGVWVDILDVPLMGYLRQMFFEPFGGRTQPLHEDAAAFTSSRASHIRPAWLDRVNGFRSVTRGARFGPPWTRIATVAEARSTASSCTTPTRSAGPDTAHYRLLRTAAPSGSVHRTPPPHFQCGLLRRRRRRHHSCR